MTERSIVEAAARLRRHGEPHLIATVVTTDPSSPRPPGARMLLTRFRWVAGSVTGGVLDGELTSMGWARTKEAPALLRFERETCPHIEDEDIRSAFGLGGDGPVDILVERASLPGRIDALEVALRCFRGQLRGAVATVYRSPLAAVRPGARMAVLAGGPIEDELTAIDASIHDAIGADLYAAVETGATESRTYATSAGPVEVLVEAVVPPPRLFLFGTGHDAVPVAQLARQLGWEVYVCTSQARFSTRERFAMADEIVVGTPAEVTARIDASLRAVAVVMNHDPDRDRHALGLVLASRARHVVALGSRAGVTDSRVRVLDRGGTPQQLALALIADAQAALDPGPLPSPPGTSERPTASRSSQVLATATVL